MSSLEDNAESLEPSDGGTSIPCSKRQKTESTAVQDEYDSTEQPEKDKTDGAEQQSGTEYLAPHGSQCSELKEGMENNSPSVSKFEEDNTQRNEKNGITEPENVAQFENELMLFYKELEKIESETDLQVNECVDASQSSAEYVGSTTVSKHKEKKTGKRCKKTTNDNTQMAGDPCTGRSQIPTCDTQQNSIMCPSRPQWNQPQAFIGPQGPPLSRFSTPFAYQRYIGPSQDRVPFPHDHLFSSNGHVSDCNSAPIQATNEICDVQTCLTNDYIVEPGHKYFYNSGPHQNNEGWPNMLRAGVTNLCQQKTEDHSRPGIGNKELVFMRGPPGSGKSTLSRLLLGQNPNGVVLSTDDYFCQNGVYWFDPSFLGEAHEWNQNRAKQSMDEGRSPIIIDNTNIQAWEMKPYVQMAVERCYKVSFREPETWWKFNVLELEKRNKHKVSREKIIQMMERFEYPISSDIVLNAVEPPRNNKVLFYLHPRSNQREGKVRKKPKVAFPLTKRTRGNTQKKKHRHRRKVKPCQNEVFDIKAETHLLAGCQDQHTTECEDDFPNEGHSEEENIHGIDLVTALRDSQESIGGQTKKILNRKLLEDGEGFKIADLLPVSCDIQMYLLESYEDSFHFENSLLISDIFWELHQRCSPLVKNYISVVDIATDEVNLSILIQKYCICVNKEVNAGFVQFPSEIKNVFKKTTLACIQRQVTTPVLEDDVVHWISKKVANLILCRNVLPNLLGRKRTICWECSDWSIDSTYGLCEQKQSIGYSFRHGDGSVKNQAEKWLNEEASQQNLLAGSTCSCDLSSTRNISQKNTGVLQLCLQDDYSTMQCKPKRFATTNILSEIAECVEEKQNFCINKTDKGTFIVQDSYSNSPSIKITSRRKSKRVYRLAPTFQLSRDIPMDSKENRSHKSLNEIKSMNYMSATNIFQSEMASVKLSVQETVGTCHRNLNKTADWGCQFCETIPLNKILNIKVKREGREKDSLLMQEFDSGTDTLKYETMHSELLPDPSNEKDVYSISPSVPILKKSKTAFTVKPVSTCLPCANLSRSSETLLSNVDSMKQDNNLSQFEQHNAASHDPCVGCELAEQSKQDDQELLLSQEKCPFLELQLSFDFALQLVELFGSPGIDPDFLCTEDCKVRLDKQVAKMIHSQWKKSAEERLKKKSSTDPNTIKDDMIHLNTKDLTGEIRQIPDHKTKEESSSALDLDRNRNRSGEDLTQTDNDQLITLSSDAQFLIT